MSMISPNELMDYGKQMILDGRDPETYEDWCHLVYYWHCRIAQSVQPEGLIIMCRLYDSILSDDVIRLISGMKRREIVE